MPNGDIISGASDGVVRIFTRAEERIAEQNVLRVHNNLLISNFERIVKKKDL